MGMGFLEDQQGFDLPFQQEYEEQPFIGYNPDDQNLSLSQRFQKVGQKKQEAESSSDFWKRNVSQHAARANEVVSGFAGNLKKAFGQASNFITSSIGEPLGIDLKESEKKTFGEPSKDSWQDFVMNPPTSSDIRERVTPVIAEKLTGDREYLEPRGEGEKIAGELTQDITSFFQPGTGQLRLATRIGTPLAGKLTQEGLKYLGVDEEKAEKAKLGVMMMTTLARQSNPAQFSRERIAQAKDMVPNNATFFSQPLFQSYQNLVNRINRGLRVPSKSKVRQGIRDLERNVDPQGRMTLQNAMDARDNVNEWIAEAGGWDVPAPVRDATLLNLNEFKTNLIRSIDQNLAQRFPEAGELYRTGYEAAAVTHQSNAISNFIEKHFGKKVSSVSAKLLFPALGGGAAILPKTAGAAAIGLPLYKTGQVLYRVGNSPTLARYYSDVIAQSAAGNIPAMIKSMEKLDAALLKEEEKDQKKNKRKVSLEEFKAGFQR